MTDDHEDAPEREPAADEHEQHYDPGAAAIRWGRRTVTAQGVVLAVFASVLAWNMLRGGPTGVNWLLIIVCLSFVVVSMFLIQVFKHTTAAFAARMGHDYLSTACHHGIHRHCRSNVNIEGGEKIPGTCKFCEARCRCWCHPWAQDSADAGAGVGS